MKTIFVLTALFVHILAQGSSSSSEEGEKADLSVALLTNPISSRHPKADTMQTADIINSSSPEACVRCSYPCSSYCCNVPPSKCCVYSGGRCYCSSSSSVCRKHQ